MSDIHFMQRALQLAYNGLSAARPNPSVGCVIVDDGKIIGEGYTSPYGGPHAEVNAIWAVRDPLLLKKSTAYVTLEPCAHHGKTPPCVDLLIEKKIKKVVIASVDPFEKVKGKGIHKLKEAGVEVEVGMMEKEATALNKRFFTYYQKKRPYIVLKWAETKEGYIARENGDSKWISNIYARQLVHKWRTEEDAILIGKHTALADNPSLTAREWEGANPVRILLDTHLQVPRTHKLFDAQVRTLIFNKVEDKTEGAIQWVRVPDMAPSQLVSFLYEAGIQSVFVEGGAKVLSSFLSENLWDEARVFTAPVTFHEGLRAPKIAGQKRSQKAIKDNILTLYQNPNG